MNFTRIEIEGVYLVEPNVIVDKRGEFFRTFDEELFSGTGLKKNFVQFNHSVNFLKGTWRGFHYQLPPKTETKLIQCVNGKILDIVLDLRKNSKTFLQWRGFELSAKNKIQVLIPDGCAHGFITLEDNSELIYHHTQFYDAKSESGIRYDDARLNLILPIQITLISDRDKSYPFLTDDFKGIET
ncbi:MAG: dTDP-4-dehydrorhamnose 3,5-epimerase [Bacteroidia bacterium]|nr:dTDP-4-dehydrorhamnose 3,5-epimerase [Bacteroidia bacterium]